MQQMEHRYCYQCKKEIENKVGKYYCSRKCWEDWKAENYKNSAENKKLLSIKEIKDRLREMGKGKKEDQFEQAKVIFK